jgi:hypothetical protein
MIPGTPLTSMNNDLSLSTLASVYAVQIEGKYAAMWRSALIMTTSSRSLLSPASPKAQNNSLLFKDLAHGSITALWPSFLPRSTNSNLHHPFKAPSSNVSRLAAWRNLSSLSASPRSRLPLQLETHQPPFLRPRHEKSHARGDSPICGIEHWSNRSRSRSSLLLLLQDISSGLSSSHRAVDQHLAKFLCLQGLPN